MDDCIFCKVAAGTAPSWKVRENEHAYAFLNINSVSRYHTLVIPKSHCINIFDAEPQALQEVMALTQEVSNLYRHKLGIEDIQIIMNAGAAAQQTVFHWHVHIVPRSKGDDLDIHWTTYPEWRSDFDTMLEPLQST